MMYGPARAQPHTTQAGPSPTPSTSTKPPPTSAKRKSSGNDQGATATADNKKRTKTQRACDSCRSRKIRCDVLPDTDPPICQHCRQSLFECTFFLPITETRFKKKKAEEEAQVQEKDSGRGTSSPKTDTQKGPTSAQHLLHSQAMIPPRTYESYDSRYNHSWEISENGDGLIHVHAPTLGTAHAVTPKQVDLKVDRDTVEKLLNLYFTEIAPIFPIVTQAEFLAKPSPSPLLLFSCCLVAAARRQFPQAIFDSIRLAVNNIIKMDDVLSTASIVNVQSLLILCMAADSHSQYVPNALSALWVRAGTAIRMAQDLGLHRAESVKQNIELRRRLWAACVISDRWVSLIYGHPYMIDVVDCDARLPSSGDSNDLYLDELLRLSVLLGRVLKTIYTPAGLMIATDEQLHKLLEDLEGWKEKLPENLRFNGPDTSPAAGLLFMLYACVNMIFWRVFMRISYTCPAHLKFSLTVEKWTNLTNITGDVIDWLDKHENMYDVWLIIPYAATSCALVQYHSWARRSDASAQAKLKKLRDCVRRWEGAISPDHMSARRKTAEIISLLYEATLSPAPSVTPPALNPTGGVTAHPPAPKLVYKQDESRPGGGVFIAQGSKEGYKDLPPGVIIESSEEEGGTSTSKQTRPPVTGSTARTESQFARTGPSVPLVGSPSPMVQSLGGVVDQNVNPAMTEGLVMGPHSAHMMNVLGAPHMSNNAAMVDLGLEGMPGGMFDWGQWDTFFQRFSGGDNHPVQT